MLNQGFNPNPLNPLKKTEQNLAARINIAAWHRLVHQTVQRVEGIRVKLVIVIWHMFEHFRKLCIAVYCFLSFEIL